MPYSAASIAFTDAAGAATLTNGNATPGDRLAGWTPGDADEGERAVGLGTGATHAFPLRTLEAASFTLEDIPAASLGIALRLKRHLLNGGVCTVATGDSAGHTYPGCGLAPDTTPEIRQTDRVECRYAMTLALANLAAPTTPMLADYSL